MFLPLALGAPARLAGQEPPRVPAGARVRVSLEPRPPVSANRGPGERTRILGTLMRPVSDSVVVYDEESGGTVALALDAVQRLEVSRGRHGHSGRGALVGLGVGLSGGLVAGLVVCADDACESSGVTTPVSSPARSESAAPWWALERGR